MDAFIVSSYVKKSLQHKKSAKKLEHAAFLINTPSMSEPLANKNSFKATDNSINDNSINDNSLRTREDNYRFADNSDSSENVYAPTDNSSNITVNNIKVVGKNNQMMGQDEDEDDEDYEEEYNNNNKANNISSITFLLMLIINSYSAYLSWECNSNKEYPLVLKVVFSFFAFVFGSLYLLYYILFRFDDCNKF